MKSKLDLINICAVQGELNAELVKARLEIEGIPAMLKYETYLNLQLGAFCPVNVFVPREHEAIARKIIKQEEPPLISTIPQKNKWTFVLLRLLSIVIGGK